MATSAISTAKDLAIEKGKQTLASKKRSSAKVAVTQKSKDLLDSMTNSETNINQLMAGQGMRIEVLVKTTLNGAGLRLA